MLRRIFAALAMALLITSTLAQPGGPGPGGGGPGGGDSGGDAPDFQATAEARQAEVGATATAMSQGLASTQAAIQAAAEETAAARQAGIEATQAAIQTEIAATGGAVQGNIEGTQAARSTDLAVTLDAQRTEISVTQAAASTAIAATAEAARAEVEAAADEITAELEAEAAAQVEEYLDSVSEYVDIEVDAENGTVAMTYTVQEDDFNIALDAALEAAGYSASSVNADFITDGIFITATDVELDSGLSGDLTMLVAVDAVNGELVVTVLYVQLNGRDLPDNVVGELNGAIQFAMDSAVSGIYDFDYSVEDAFTTETTLVLDILVTIDALSEISLGE